MATKLFVGSLAWGTTDDSLRELFATVGEVASASVIMDRETNRSKGFGFVEMSSDDEAKKAVEELNNKELDGRTIIVNEARPREERPRSFGGGQGGGGGGGGGYNRGGGGGGGSRGGDNRW
jgi:RNA recognition motif-containing protein